MNHLVKWMHGGITPEIDDDILEVFGINGLQRRNDPLNAQLTAPKHQLLELCGLGEVKQSGCT